MVIGCVMCVLRSQFEDGDLRIIRFGGVRPSAGESLDSVTFRLSKGWIRVRRARRPAKNGLTFTGRIL